MLEVADGLNKDELWVAGLVTDEETLKLGAVENEDELV